jgi:3-hydroxyisobutyrate dehydrogenase
MVEPIKAGVIGLGAMGAPMARHLAGAGLLGMVWNRTRAVADTLAKETGAGVAEGPEQLAAGCNVILTCVSADEDLLEVVTQLLPGVKTGSVLVDTSTVSPATAREVADRLDQAGAGFVDAPVSGGVEGAKKGTLSVMAGGDSANISRIMPVLEAISGTVTHMGPVGSGQATKAVNQVMAAGINQAVTEALAFAGALELPLEKVIDVVGSGAAGNWFLRHRGPGMTQGGFAPGFRVALHHKDLAICREMAARFGVALPVVEMTLIHYRRLMEAGFGDEDISALFREKLALFDPGSGIPRRP